MEKKELSPRQTWSAVGSMGLCVSMLIAAEFMPVSLLTPIARDLRATEGMAGHVLPPKKRTRNLVVRYSY
jgi:predicted MFS family arabinose efflux permease